MLHSKKILLSLTLLLAPNAMQAADNHGTGKAVLFLGGVLGTAYVVNGVSKSAFGTKLSQTLKISQQDAANFVNIPLALGAASMAVSALTGDRTSTAAAISRGCWEMARFAPVAQTCSYFVSTTLAQKLMSPVPGLGTSFECSCQGFCSKCFVSKTSVAMALYVPLKAAIQSYFS